MWEPDGPYLVDAAEIENVQVGRARTPAFLKTS
jgi:hypothetical protein